MLKFAPAILLALALAPSTGCAAREGDRQVAPRAQSVTRPLPRPAACTRVPAGQALQSWVDRAPAGSALCLDEGTFRGPVKIERRLTLWGSRGSVVRSHGIGTTILVTAARTELLGFTIDGSGTRYDQQDAAVAVRADEVRVQGLRVVRATFGILADRSRGLTIRDNEVLGDPRQSRGLRGDGIRLWETRASLVEGNLMRDSRDLVVWYSPGNRILRNRVEHGRYGTHLMYSHDNVVSHNEMLGNAVGVFVMYSHGIEITHNSFLDSYGPGGMGVGLKDSGDVTIEQNVFVHDGAGLYVDNSPSTMGQKDLVRGNTFRLCDGAVVFHGDTAGNELRGNSLASNRQQVVVEGGGDARHAVWEGNYYDDYVGYDLDADGVGDVPYELRRLSTHLSSDIPSLAFFTGTPAFGVLDVLGKVVPLFTPHTLFADPRPVMTDPVGEVRRAD